MTDLQNIAREWADGQRKAAAEDPRVELDRLRAILADVRGHARAVLVQAAPSDDKIIIDHVRAIYAACEGDKLWPLP